MERIKKQTETEKEIKEEKMDMGRKVGWVLMALDDLTWTTRAEGNIWDSAADLR